MLILMERSVLGGGKSKYLVETLVLGMSSTLLWLIAVDLRDFFPE